MSVPGLLVAAPRSSSGKTTVINAVAGLLTPDAGRISVDDLVLLDRARRVALPMHRRRLGYVFQEARLFPHLTVRQNLAFGRWFTPARERRDDPGTVIELLGIGHLLDRRPGLLSGGEKQRVAIGRALLASPRLLLMDEPLASLDEERKAEILPYIERLRDKAGVPIVENRPLARALYAAVEIEHPIPAEHYAAVAEIIGYVMRIARARS